jgi:NAD(P)-dependent dehydrogenase (short-subunit alcohol dehydrogenase family)
MKLQDRVALITGGSSGIGRAAAVAMARAGAKVALTARRAERCQEAVEEIEGMGGEALALPGDVANAEHVQAQVAATVERWGRLDIVVPNAGINGVFAPIEDITPEEWDQTHNIHVRGIFLTVKYAISQLHS